jgi:thiol-disulfide isomerase/thioredoxin
MKRVHFITGVSAFAAALPAVASAGEANPSPAPTGPPGTVTPAPSPDAAGGKADPRLAALRAKHVHGPNGVVRLSTDRPVEWTMEVLDGPQFRLSDYRGKLVYINIFATWCEPCRNEQTALVAFADAHRDDTAVIGVTYLEPDDDVRAYRKRFHIDYPIAMDRYGRFIPGLIMTPKGDDFGFPTTLVFRPDGRLWCAWFDEVDREWFEAERLAALASTAA